MKTKKYKNKSYHKGAFDERRAWMKKLKRLLEHNSMVFVTDLIKWGKTRRDRYKKSKGGL